MPKEDTFRDGKVHVVSEKCKTCIFRPGNRMRLEPGRVKGMVEDSIADDSAIVCHSTLAEDTPGAVCRGFWDSYRAESAPLRLADALDMVEYDEPCSIDQRVGQ